ncbi:MAG: right-handed parallel beta-helix repeat-containing protein [Acidobacteria bacterium]|nr:right-handed parallel beta-helix repeat-containing protein [Acidobacteriota bacterium]
MNETGNTAVPRPAGSTNGRLRRLLMLIIVLLGLLCGAILVLGMIPFTPDIPPAGLSNGNPGSGGLRRPFPEMNQRANNPTTPEKVELGRLLYFDPALSGDNTQSCATCHHPDLGFTDGRNFAMGKGGKGTGPERTAGKQIKRGSPTIWNAAFYHKLFWDGRAKDLEDQARSPITSPDEMDQNPDELVKELKAIPEYSQMFDKAFGGHNGSAVTFENVTGAIAAFERTIISNDSPFDRYAAGDPDALTPEQRHGLTLFRSLKTRCFECHGFPTFANPDFKVIGVPQIPGQEEDLGRAVIEGGEPYKYAFKVPTLRNVALTAPYMHNGRFQTLEEVITFYSIGGGPSFGMNLPNLDDKIRRFIISPAEKKALIAFLHALTDESKKPDFPARVPSGLPIVPRLNETTKGQPHATPARTPAADQIPQRQPTTWRIKPGELIQAALDRTVPGDTIEILPGLYHETLLIDVDNITIRGLKQDGQKPVLDGRNMLTDAVITSSHNFTIEGLVIKDFVNNGITVHGGTNATFRELEVHNAGLYGVYPVECKGVLVENCLVTGIKDAAIYVGQSRDIIVRNNEAHNNVTGIEIENSVNALVENNYVHDNTGGILVFLLPNNPSKVGSDTRVLRNRVINNNHPNFGDPTSIVGKVIPGTGLLIMAADRTEVSQNEIRGNNNFGLAVVGLAIAFPRGKTFDVGAVPEGNRIYGNTFAENGRNPGGIVKEMGALNVDLIWDGSGWDNSWNQPGAKSFPAVLPGDGWPSVARRSYARVFSFLRERLM